MLELSSKFKNKRAFITGAASGLGLAFALELARDGWNIAMTDLNQDSLASAVEQVARVAQPNKGKAVSYALDVTDYKQFEKVVSDFKEHSGSIDLVINSAGIACGGRLDEVTIETFQKVIDINLMGTVNSCHIFSALMKGQKSGYILNIASAAAFVSAPRMAAYNVSKAGVLSLSETLRSELADSNVIVSVLMPTYIRTAMAKGTLGPAQYKKRTEVLMEQADLEAPEVVADTLKAMAAEKLYIVLPAQARYLWLYKRLWPQRFCSFIKKEAERRLLQIDRQLGI